MTKDRIEVELPESMDLMQDILDSMASPIAVLDHAGVIVAINEAWVRIFLENNKEPGKTVPNAALGSNYLEICGANVDAFADETLNTRNGILAVLEARLPTFSIDYPFHSQQERRWFMMTVTPLSSDRGGAIVFHSNVTERKRMEEQIRNLDYYDSLTKLPEGRLLNDRLGVVRASSKRSGFYGALLALDLGNIKRLNDEHGHAAGDLLLIEVARRLCVSVREVDTVARLGGDEFAILLSQLHKDRFESASQARLIAEKIRAKLCEPYRLTLQQEGETDSIVEHHCTASIGVVLFFDHETHQDNLLKWAESAMYQAKHAGNNLIRFYNPHSSVTANEVDAGG